MKKVLLVLSLFVSTLIMNSCGVLSYDTWYDIGYDIGRAISVNTNEGDNSVEEQSVTLIEKNI